MFRKPDILCMLNYITETIQVTEDCKYFVGSRMLFSPALCLHRVHRNILNAHNLTSLCVPSCLHRASIVSKHFLLFQLMHTIIKSQEC
jgi:hypothetical protein